MNFSPCHNSKLNKVNNYRINIFFLICHVTWALLRGKEIAKLSSLSQNVGYLELLNYLSI